MYGVLSLNLTKHLKRSEMYAGFSSSFIILFGFCTVLTKSIIYCSIFIIISATMLIITLYLLNLMLNDKLLDGKVGEIHDNIQLISEIRLKRRGLTLLLIILMPAFPFVYMLSAIKVLDPDYSLLAFCACNLLTKVLFVARLLITHSNSISAIETAAGNAARRAFLRYVMHEVRGPLNSVSSGIGVLKSASPTEDISETLLMMDSATIFMAETLNNILSMQKIEEGKLELVMESFIVSDLVKAVSTALYGILKEKKINLQSNINIDVPFSIIGDRYRLEHALANLLSNAAKFTPVGGHISIEVSASNVVINESCLLCFSVTDSGPGMSESQISLLFKPFTQINPHELQYGGGTGLGLSICKGIVELHEGTVGVKSQIGEGSTFYFTAVCRLDSNTDLTDLQTKSCHFDDSCYLSLEDCENVRCPSYLIRRISTQSVSGLENCRKLISCGKRALVVDGM